MTVKMACPNPACDKRYALADEVLGRSIRCKGCGHTFVAGDSVVQHRTVLSGALEPARQRGAQSATVPAPPAPDVIGRFQIRAKLGTGAFGTVYRAFDPQLDREVALKVPNPGVMADAKHAERFLREAKAAANLRHPHIVPVFDAGKSGDAYYIATAFIDGQPLSDAIPEGGTDFGRAARLAHELADALAYAHDQGIVHRDVKPQNVMLDQQDRVHLLDFGLAARQDGAAKLTKAGTVMGTPAYMAPEQAAGQAGDAQPATDQYAVGVVLYELLTGTVPFKGPLAAVLHNVIHADPAPPRRLRPDVPRDLETICLKAMAKRPEDRYPACHALAADLRRWLEGEPITARRMSLRERAARWVRKEPKLAGALAAAAVALLAGVLLVSAAAQSADTARQRAEQEATKAQAAQQKLEQAINEALGHDGTVADLQSKWVVAEARAANQQRRTEAAEDETNELRLRAEVAQTEADNLRDRAKAARTEADDLHDQTRDLEVKLNAARRRSAQAANEEYQHGALDKAREILNATPDERRGWEWGHLSALVDGAPNNPLVIPVKTDGIGYLSVAALSPDGTRVATSWSTENKVRLWDARTGKSLPTVGSFGKPVTAMAFNADGTQLVTCSEGVGQVWNTETGESVRNLKGTGASLVAALSPDGTRFLISNEKNSIRIFNTSDWTPLLIRSSDGQSKPAVVSPGGQHAIAVAYGDGGKKFATLAADSRIVRLWTGDGSKLSTSGTGEHTNDIAAIAYSPDGKWIVTGGRDQRVCLWDATNGKVKRTFVDRSSRARAEYPKQGPHPAPVDVIYPVHVVAFSPDGTRLVTGGEDFVVRIWDVASGELLLKLPYPTAPRVDKHGLSLSYKPGVHTIAWSKDGDRLMVARAHGLEICDRRGAAPAPKP